MLMAGQEMAQVCVLYTFARLLYMARHCLEMLCCSDMKLALLLKCPSFYTFLFASLWYVLMAALWLPLASTFVCIVGDRGDKSSNIVTETLSLCLSPF